MPTLSSHPSAFTDHAFFRPRAICFLALVGLLGAGLLPMVAPTTAHATTHIWLGEGGNNNWNNATNWFNGAPPSDLASTDLVFGASSSTLSTLNSAYSIHALSWMSTASAYTFGGSVLTIGAGGLNQNAANAQTFNNAVVLGAAQTWNLANSAARWCSMAALASAAASTR